jgi:hypothetical protein
VLGLIWVALDHGDALAFLARFLRVLSVKFFPTAVRAENI